jgi:hypothetical protein
MYMKTFEERYNEWLDGSFDAESDPEFLRELEKRQMHPKEKDDWNALRNLLQEHCAAPALEHPDFFNHQLREKLAALAQEPAQPRRGWRLPKLAWLGAGFVAAALVLFTQVPGLRNGGDSGNRSTKIVSAVAEEPGVYVASIDAPEQGYALLWIDGMDYLPPEHRIQ